MIGAVDVLFVDEAGQISLANVVAISRATDSLVLLGDPQQLDQPLKGSHPPGADRSALAHVLAGEATMPPIAACSSRPPGDSIRSCARSRPRSSTTTGSNRSRISPCQRLVADGAVDRRAASGRGCSRC